MSSVLFDHSANRRLCSIFLSGTSRAWEVATIESAWFDAEVPGVALLARWVQMQGEPAVAEIPPEPGPGSDNVVP